MLNIKECVVFTDASYDPALQLGVGGKLVLEGSVLEEANDRVLDALPIETVVFQNTTASRCELQTVLWALENLSSKPLSPKVENHTLLNIKLYTDCKNIYDLTSRRPYLEATNYVSKRSKKVLAQADLYKRFFALSDQLKLEVKWIAGHVPKEKRGLLNKIFARVDQWTREQLRAKIARLNNIERSLIRGNDGKH